MKYKIIEHLNIDSKYYTIKLKKFLFWRTVKSYRGNISCKRRFDNLEEIQDYINIILRSKRIPVKTVIEKGKV